MFLMFRYYFSCMAKKYPGVSVLNPVRMTTMIRKTVNVAHLDNEKGKRGDRCCRSGWRAS